MAFNRNYFLLHFIVFIWGWTAILGKAIELSAIQLVWLRIPVALAGVILYMMYKKVPLGIPFKTLMQSFGVGLIVALHWMCFYSAIKESNVSVTLACFSTGSLFTAFIEPLFYKRRVIWYEILFGLLVIGALYIIFQVETQYKLGMILGVAAALTSSIFGVLNGVLVKQGKDPNAVSLYEMLGGFLGLTVFVLLTGQFSFSWFSVSAENTFYLLLLGIACTTVPFLIGMHILKNISPYTVSLTLNLEVVYGIIFAYFIYNEHEQMTTTFYIGTVIILSTIFANAALKNYLKG